MIMQFTPDQLQQLSVMATLMLFTAGFLMFGGGAR